MHRLASVALPLATLLLAATPTLAQKRSAELDRLDFLVGTWDFTYQGSPGTWECEWFGATFVRCGAETTGSSGNRIATVDVFAHDAIQGVYSWYRFLTNGVPEEAIGRIQDDDWTFVFHEPFEGNRRASFLVETPEGLTIRWENALEGGGWETASEIRMTKKG